MALHFLSGENKGKEFILPEDSDMVLGRSEEDDVLVDDPGAAHRHALVSNRGGKVTLRNVDKKFGTVVNKKPVEEVTLEEGDRIRICKVMCMLVTVNRFSTALSGVGVRARMEKLAAALPKSITGPGSTISGTIKEVPLVDLLQFLCNSNQSGALKLMSGQKGGVIHLRQGQVLAATVNGSPDLDPKKAFFRLVRWKSGTFSLDATDGQKVETTITEPISSLLLEAAQLTDSMSAIEDDLPKPGAKLTVAKVKSAGLKDLSMAELNFYSFIQKHGTLQEILDNYDGDEVAACTMLVELIRRDLVQVG